MSDSAKGPSAGYLFQFEKALLLLSNLDKLDDFISIEDVDDTAVHKADGTVLVTVQTKHSISASGSTFEDTSYALWRTFQIWVEKLEQKVFNNKTQFTCCTNKKIGPTSLLYKIERSSFKQVIEELKALVQAQEAKLKDLKERKSTNGNSIKQTIKLIKFVLSKEIYFEIIKKNLVIASEETVKEAFLNRIHLNSSRITDTQKKQVYESFFGWITSNSKAKWKNGTEARFTKKNFDEKHYQINSNPSIINAVFRTKKDLGSIANDRITQMRVELFVKQIEDIKRNEEAKDRIIKDAILDFLYFEIETYYIVDKGDYTQDDFEEFLDECQLAWQACFDQNVIKEIHEYNEDEKNMLAITIYDCIMNKIEIRFKDGFSFTTNNKYIRNGSFLKLSNIPKLGWHPGWKTRYQN